MKRIFILIIILLNVFLCFSEEILVIEKYVQPKEIGKLPIGTLGTAIDNEENLYFGNNLSIYKMGKDRTISLYAEIEKLDRLNYDGYRLICDLEFDHQYENIYIAARDRIYKLGKDKNVQVLYEAKKKYRNGIFGIAIDKKNNVYFSYLNKIFRITPENIVEEFLSDDKIGIRLDSLMGLEFDSECKYLYACETDYGLVLKIEINEKNPPGKIEVVFEKSEYGPRCIKITENGNILIKDCSSKYFYLIKRDSIFKIIVDEIKQKSWGLESFVIDKKDKNRIYSHVWDGYIYSFDCTFM